MIYYVGQLPAWLLLSVWILGFNQAAATCSKPVNPKRAIVFLDTNASFLEVEKAQEAACLRGEQLIVLPGLKTSREVWPYLKDVSYLEEMVSKYNCKHRDQSRRNPRKCKKYSPQLVTAQNRISKFLKKYGTADEESFTRLAKELASKDVAITTIIASGHDGGGNISGELGDIHKMEITSVINSAYASKPELLKQLNSILLWGCYTATPTEILYWKSLLPSLDIIAGFSSSGPLNSRPSSGGLMKDLLVKSDQLLLQSEGRELHRALREVNYMLDGLPALFVRTCNHGEYYYHRTEDDIDDKVILEEFGPFEQFLNCEAEDAAYYTALMPYFDGEQEVPYETSGTKLRSLYRKVRQSAHCFGKSNENNSYLTGDRVGLLLFFNEVKKNFAAHFADLIRDAQKELENLDFNKINQMLAEQKLELEDKLDHVNKKERKAVEEQLRIISKTVGNFAHNSTLEEKVWFPNLKNIKHKSRSEILDNIGDLRNLVESYGLSQPKVLAHYGKLHKLSKLMNSHLYNLDIGCMDFLAWHQYKQNKIPKSECQ